MDRHDLTMVERSYKHGDYLPIMVGDRIFVADEWFKHRKEGTIEFVADEVDRTCFENNGEYFGETLGRTWRIILADPYVDCDNAVETIYYADELVELA